MLRSSSQPAYLTLLSTYNHRCVQTDMVDDMNRRYEERCCTTSFRPNAAESSRRNRKTHVQRGSEYHYINFHYPSTNFTSVTSSLNSSARTSHHAHSTSQDVTPSSSKHVGREFTSQCDQVSSALNSRKQWDAK